MVTEEDEGTIDALHAVAQLVLAAERMRQAIAEHLGITVTDTAAVSVLHEHGGLTASELARALGLTAGAITAAVDRLVKAGLARRRRGVQDRRRVGVTLTELGRETAERINTEMAAALRHVDADALGTAMATMRKIGTGLLAAAEKLDDQRVAKN